MTQVKWFDCSCEDYPCCGHFDILHGDENEPQQCNMCGGFHPYDYDCDYDDYDEDEVDEDDDGDPVELDTPMAENYGG